MAGNYLGWTGTGEGDGRWKTAETMPATWTRCRGRLGPEPLFGRVMNGRDGRLVELWGDFRSAYSIFAVLAWCPWEDEPAVALSPTLCSGARSFPRVYFALFLDVSGPLWDDAYYWTGRQPCSPRCLGQRPEDEEYLLQGEEVPEAHPAQGHPIQDGQGLAFRAGLVSRIAVLWAWPHAILDPGKRRYDRKQSGYGGQTKPVFHKKAKTTKKIVLRLECTACKVRWKLREIVGSF